MTSWSFAFTISSLSCPAKNEKKTSKYIWTKTTNIWQIEITLKHVETRSDRRSTGRVELLEFRSYSRELMMPQRLAGSCARNTTQIYTQQHSRNGFFFVSRYCLNQQPQSAHTDPHKQKRPFARFQICRVVELFECLVKFMTRMPIAWKKREGNENGENPPIVNDRVDWQVSRMAHYHPRRISDLSRRCKQKRNRKKNVSRLTSRACYEDATRACSQCVCVCESEYRWTNTYTWKLL